MVNSNFVKDSCFCEGVAGTLLAKEDNFFSVKDLFSGAFKVHSFLSLPLTVSSIDLLL